MNNLWLADCISDSKRSHMILKLNLLKLTESSIKASSDFYSTSTRESKKTKSLSFKCESKKSKAPTFEIQWMTFWIRRDPRDQRERERERDYFIAAGIPGWRGLCLIRTMRVQDRIPSASAAASPLADLGIMSDSKKKGEEKERESWEIEEETTKTSWEFEFFSVFFPFFPRLLAFLGTRGARGCLPAIARWGIWGGFSANTIGARAPRGINIKIKSHLSVISERLRSLIRC